MGHTVGPSLLSQLTRGCPNIRGAYFHITPALGMYGKYIEYWYRIESNLLYSTGLIIQSGINCD